MDTSKFTVAEDLKSLDAAALAAAITQGNEALDFLFAIEEPTEEQVAEAERIAAAVESLKSEETGRVTAATDRAERMEALKNSRVEAATVEPDEVVDEDDDDEDDDDAEPETEEAEAEKVAVTAAAKKAPVLVKRKRPEVPVSKINAGKMVLTAAADVPQFAAGSDIPDIAALTKAVINRAKGFPSRPAGIKGAPMQKFAVATLEKPYDPEYQINREDDAYEVIERVAKERNLPGGSLTAAGGWCAPSETLYDFCEGESTDGLWDVPEVQVRRGGIRFTPGPTFADLYTNSGFTQTEAEAISGTEKDCYTVACPSWTDVRLDAVGICIKVPILTNAAYPELVQRVISLALVAQQHRVSAALLTKAMTAAGTAVASATIGGTVSDTLAALELQAETQRNVYRLPLGATMEVVLPYWVRAAMRADLANRNGVDLLAVSDQQLNSYFSARKLNVQWVYNFGTALAAAEEGYPATVQGLIYPAGTFVKGTSDVISLSAVYDAASLEVNEYTGLFAEEGVLLANRCYAAKKITIPLCQAGKTGAASLTGCYTLS